MNCMAHIGWYPGVFLTIDYRAMMKQSCLFAPLNTLTIPQLCSNGHLFWNLDNKRAGLTAGFQGIVQPQTPVRETRQRHSCGNSSLNLRSPSQPAQSCISESPGQLQPRPQGRGCCARWCGHRAPCASRVLDLDMNHITLHTVI